MHQFCNSCAYSEDPRADRISQSGPIALINVVFKHVVKCFVLHLGLIAAKIVERSWTTFIKGQFILEGVVCLNELVHKLKRKMLSAIILKLDFEMSKKSTFYSSWWLNALCCVLASLPLK